MCTDGRESQLQAPLEIIPMKLYRWLDDLIFDLNPYHSWFSISLVRGRCNCIKFSRLIVLSEKVAEPLEIISCAQQHFDNAMAPVQAIHELVDD